MGQNVRQVVCRVPSEGGRFGPTRPLMIVVGEIRQGWKMRRIIPTEDGLVGKELIRVEQFCPGVDESHLQPIGRSEELTANFIQGTLRNLIGKEDIPRRHYSRGCQECLNLLKV